MQGPTTGAAPDRWLIRTRQTSRGWVASLSGPARLWRFSAECELEAVWLLAAELLLPERERIERTDFWIWGGAVVQLRRGRWLLFSTAGGSYRWLYDHVLWKPA